MTDIAAITHETMEPYVGSTFTIDVEGQEPLELKLHKVRVLVEKHLVRDAIRDSFGLYFHTAPGVLVQQGTYTLRQPDLGELLLFLVPLGKAGDGYELEAIFT